MSYLQLALLLLQAGAALVRWIQSRADLQAGEQKAVAQAAVDVLKLTDYGRHLADKIDDLSRADTDILLSKLGGSDTE